MTVIYCNGREYFYHSVSRQVSTAIYKKGVTGNGRAYLEIRTDNTGGGDDPVGQSQPQKWGNAVEIIFDLLTVSDRFEQSLLFIHHRKMAISVGFYAIFEKKIFFSDGSCVQTYALNLSYIV